ncbi:MAG: hypothetical protein NC419_09220 [Muribaculaceae bacterium]|nr:hypothetical protein [Muribaculaceae bacterium]
MAKNKIEIFHSMRAESYRLMWHVSALAGNRYRIAILSDKRGVIDEVTYRGAFYEQCLTMNQTVSPKDETLYLEIENDAEGLDVYPDDRIDGGGLGESACYFCRKDDSENYHEAAILLWAVKEAEDELTYQAGAEPELAVVGTDTVKSSLSYPLRNLAGQSCVSYFLCGHTTENMTVKIWDGQKEQEKPYVNLSCQCTDNIAQLMMGSMLTKREGLQLEIEVTGNDKITIACDCTVAKGHSLALIHYHVKSYDTEKNSLPFAMDILGWTAI